MHRCVAKDRSVIHPPDQGSNGFDLIDSTRGRCLVSGAPDYRDDSLPLGVAADPVQVRGVKFNDSDVGVLDE
jgi:hypothetical protein